MEDAFNLFTSLPGAISEEVCTHLATASHVRIERIVSHGHCSPDDFWYDQDEHEWVVVLSGQAALQFADEEASRSMQPGDFVNIAAHRKHRVAWTTPDEPTIWLAVFYR